MSKPPELIEPADGGVTLRLYRTPWQGEVLFACRKCQRRVKRNDGPAALSKLKSWFKVRSRKQQRTPLRVIDMTCVKLCPRDGVTVFSRRHLAHEPPGLCIARSEDDLETLYCELTDVALSSAKLTL